MIKSPRKNVVGSATSWSPVGRASNWATQADVFTLNIVTPHLFTILVLKFEIVHSTTSWCVFNSAGWVANSVHPDQVHLIWVYTVCRGLSVQILRVIMVPTRKILYPYYRHPPFPILLNFYEAQEMQRAVYIQEFPQWVWPTMLNRVSKYMLPQSKLLHCTEWTPRPACTSAMHHENTPI